MLMLAVVLTVAAAPVVVGKGRKRKEMEVYIKRYKNIVFRALVSNFRVLNSKV